MHKLEDRQAKALRDLQQSHVLMIDGHFDYLETATTGTSI